METSGFVDYYEILEISSNAGTETVERMFRYLARRYHPDNQATADRDRFDLVLQAYNTLRDPIKRAEFDIEYECNLGLRSELRKDVNGGEVVDRDIDLQHKLLALFYAKRRRNAKDPGLGDGELEYLVGCPIEHLEFNIWYMKERRWIERTENGTFAITVEGVDRVCSDDHAAKKLLTDQS
jgi:curved DNA-binding protein CbpA